MVLAAQVSSIWAAELPELTPPAQTGRFLVTMKSGDLERVAHVQVPGSYKPESPPPLVLVLHGAGGNGRVSLDHNGWSAKAEKNGFVVVAPDGLPALIRAPATFRANPALWNSGQLNSRSPRAAIDDVEYIRQLLDELKIRVPYDPRRVYCCGHSNGGGMTFRLANELSERFAAVGTVAGMLAIDEPKPRKPMPTLYILGTKDPLTPIEGGQVQLPWGARHNPPVAESMAKWAKALGCETQPETVSDSDGIKKQVYQSKSSGPTLTVLLIDGHGHMWPGSKSFLPETVTGPVTSKLNATDALWDFFNSVK
jgi:polyhydroxybutyrate depolymerase